MRCYYVQCAVLVSGTNQELMAKITSRLKGKTWDKFYETASIVHDSEAWSRYYGNMFYYQVAPGASTANLAAESFTYSLFTVVRVHASKRSGCCDIDMNRIEQCWIARSSHSCYQRWAILLHPIQFQQYCLTLLTSMNMHYWQHNIVRCCAIAGSEFLAT